MITIKEDSILNAKENIIVNHVDINGIMSSKISRDIITKYPIVYNEYRKLYESKKSTKNSLLGKCQIIKIDDKSIVNIFGQKYNKNKKLTDYNALVKGLVSLTRKAKEDIAIPNHIGCKDNSIDWERLLNILQILDFQFDHNIIIYNYKPKD